MAESDPRGHHLLAQLYQRGFANEAGQARVIDRATGRTFTNSIANIFKRRDFNAFWDEDGELCQDVERLLADQVDSPAGRGFVALRRGEFPLPADQREDVARFIAAQLTRGRHFRGTTAAFMGDVGDHVLALMNQHYTDAHWERALGYVPSAEACREMVAQGYTPGKGELLDMMLAPIDDITGQVLGRLWTLLNFRQPCNVHQRGTGHAFGRRAGDRGRGNRGRGHASRQHHQGAPLDVAGLGPR